MEQVIYSRLEYPTADSFITVLEKLIHLPRLYNNNGIQISGVSVAMGHTHSHRGVILLTYDEESDCYIKLAYSSIPGAIYTNLRKINI